MNNPETRKQWIYDLLISEPTISHGECFGRYSVTFGKSDKTFDKEWLVAKQRFEQYQARLNEAKDKATIEAETEAVKSGHIKSRIGALGKLTEIIDGEDSKASEIISAIKTMADMEGWNSPVKNEITGKMETFISEDQEKDFKDFLKSKYKFK